MNKEIKLSICCLTYNHKDFISRAIDSFLEQITNFDFEILINDDSSTDGTVDILKKYEEKFPDIIKVLYHDENQYSKGIFNPSGVFNFPRARGKYIALCEGDDYFIDKYKLQKQFDYMENNQNCSACIHSAKVENVSNDFVGKYIKPYKKSKILSQAEVIDKKNAYPTASLFFRTKYVKQLPDFYFSCFVGDIPLHIILAKYGYFYYFDEAMSVYRVGHSVSWSKKQKEGDYEKKQEEYFENLKNTYLAFDKFSNYKFTTQVKSAIRRIRFLTYVNMKKYSEILKKENKGYYRELDFKTRFFIKLEYYLPKLYIILRKGYRKE